MSLLHKLNSLVTDHYAIRLNDEMLHGSSSVNCLVQMSGKAVLYPSDMDVNTAPHSAGRDAEASPGIPFGDGDVLILPPDTALRLSSLDNLQVCVVALNPEIMIDLMDNGFSMCSVHVCAGTHALAAALRSYILTANTSSSESDPEYSDSCFRILRSFLALDEEYLQSRLSESAFSSPRQMQFFRDIVLYISAHYREDLSLNSISREFQVTPQYFASFLKKQTGTTFHQYLQDVRIRKAKLYARYTALDEDAIAFRVHLAKIPDLRDSQKLFPGTAGKQPQENNAGRIPGSNIAEERVFSMLSQKSSRKTAVRKTITAAKEKEIQADVRRFRSFHSPWNEIINLGYASDFLKSNYTDFLDRSHRDFNIRYGRICRLFDLISYTAFHGKTQSNFNLLFHVLDQIIECGMLPHIELSNKLFRIQLDQTAAIPVNEAHGTIRYFEELVSLMPDFVRACINHFGPESFSKWQFEFSYSLDDLHDVAEELSPYTYIQYFRKIQDIIKQYSPSTRIGAPGFNSWDNPQRFIELLKIFESNDAVPDFATAYIYPMTRGNYPDSSLVISSDEAIVEKRIHLLSSSLRISFPGLELWITEFNSNLSSRNIINDSCYQASYLVKHMTASINTGCHAIGYYMLPDRPLRFSDNLDLLFGGWGLITENDIPKPSWHALHMLSLLGEQIVKIDRNVVVTRHNSMSYQCLLYHYEHLRPDAANRNLTREDFELPESIFQESPEENITLRLNGISPGSYLIKELIVNSSRANILHEWRQTGYRNLEGYYNVRALRRRSEMIPEITTVEVNEEETLTRTIFLRYNEVHLLLIDRC